MNSLSRAAGAAGTAVPQPVRLSSHVLRVLDRDRNAEQRPIVAGAASPVGLPGVDQGPLAHHAAKGVELGLEALNPRQVELDQLARRHLATPDHLRLMSGAGECQ